MRKYNEKKAEEQLRHENEMRNLQNSRRHRTLQGGEEVEAEEALHKETLTRYWDECLAAIGEVTCPFCFYALPMRDALDETNWK